MKSKKPMIILEEEIIISNEWLELKSLKVEMHTGHILPSYYFVNNRDVVCVIALTDNEEVVCITEYRLGIDRYYTQFVTGYIDAGEEPLDAAKRELLEETGYQAEEFIFLGKLHGNPARSTYFLHFFLAKKATPATEVATQDHSEVIVTKIIPIKDIILAKDEGAFADLTSLSAWVLAKEYLGSR